MFDLKDLADKMDYYEAAWKSRKLSAVSDTVQYLNQKISDRRDLIQKKESLLADRNRASEEIALKKKAGEDIRPFVEAQKEIGPAVKKAESDLKAIEEELYERLAHLPNVPHSSVPEGSSEEDNKEVHRWGETPRFDFDVLSHEEFGEKRSWFQFEKATQLTGSRFSVSLGVAAQLERALIQFMLDTHTRKNGYQEVIPPFIVNSQTLFGTGNLPKFREDLFKLENHDYFLIPTAEVPLTNLHSGELLKHTDLPLYYTAYTPCFRSEAGSYGKDLKGLIRQHQFNKVELVKIVHPDKSYDEHEKMRRNAEEILEALELPYRTVLLCTGDMGFASTKTYDLEVWLPSQNRYREISSVSNCEDFQARRMMTRFKDEDGKIRYVHTLNGSGLAVGRALIAILENYQTKTGTLRIPKVLQSYVGAEEV